MPSEEPLRGASAGVEGASLFRKYAKSKGDYGYNARYDTWLSATGIDPAKVTARSPRTPHSIAGMFLTTECVIARKDTPQLQPPGMAWAA